MFFIKCQFGKLICPYEEDITYIPEPNKTLHQLKQISWQWLFQKFVGILFPKHKIVISEKKIATFTSVACHFVIIVTLLVKPVTRYDNFLSHFLIKHMFCHTL